MIFNGNITDAMFEVPDDECPRFRRHMNLVFDFSDPICRMVEFIPYEERCSFIHTNPHCQTLIFFINYLSFYYCTMQPRSTLAVIGCIIFLSSMCIYLYDVLGLAAGDFLTPALTILTTMMKLSEAVAGITLLAFSNAAPAVLANMASIASERSSLYSDVFGSALTSVLVVTGILIAFKPLTVDPFSFLRDVGFLLLDALYTDYAVKTRECVNVVEAGFLIFIYVLYITVVCVDQFLENRQMKNLGSVQDNESASSDVDQDYTRYEYYDPAHKKNEFIFWSLGETLRPYDVDEWQRAGKCKKAYKIIQMPVRFLFKCFIPVVDFSIPMHGWCKLLHSSQLITLPTIFTYCLLPSGAKMIALYVFVATIPFAIFVFCHSRTDLPPVYFKAYPVLAILGSAYLVYAIAKESCAILEVVGMTTHRSSAFLGCTLLAVGDCIGALVADFALIKKGYVKMGISSCFGVPLLNTLMSLGITWLYQAAKHDSLSVKAGQGTMGVTCEIFLVVSLFGAAFAGLATNFVLRRSQGIFLLLLYAFFLVFAVLSEFEVIHAYGTEHSMDSKPYVEN